jgi:uncharacterized protein
MTVTDNQSASRYELRIDGQTAFANYHRTDDVLYIDYVEAPPALRGTGAASQLMIGVMAHAKQNNLKVFPICSYAVSWLRKHPEYKDQIS